MSSSASASAEAPAAASERAPAIEKGDSRTTGEAGPVAQTAANKEGPNESASYCNDENVWTAVVC